MTGQAKARGTYEQRKALAVARNAEIAKRDAEARAIRMAKRAASPEGRRRAKRHQAIKPWMAMASVCVGTIGHADHGKPILIQTPDDLAKGRYK